METQQGVIYQISVEDYWKVRNEEIRQQKYKHLWNVFVTYLTVSYVISLQGSEGFLLNLKTLRKLRERATKEYFWISLLGKLKGEKVEKEHNIPCTNITSSGINVKWDSF